LVVLLAVSVVLMIIGRHSPLSVYFTLDGLHNAILDAGGFGVALFIILYTVGVLMNLPGVLFLFIGFMIYGDINGLVVVYLASMVAITVHFYFVRFMAGEAFSEIKQPFILSQMKKLEDRPIKTTIILRLIFYVSPPASYALALSPIKAKDFLIGSAISFPASILIYYGLVLFTKEQWLRWVM